MAGQQLLRFAGPVRVEIGVDQVCTRFPVCRVFFEDPCELRDRGVLSPGFKKPHPIRVAEAAIRVLRKLCERGVRILAAAHPGV